MRKDLILSTLLLSSAILQQSSSVSAVNLPLEFHKNPFLDFFHCLPNKFKKSQVKIEQNSQKLTLEDQQESKNIEGPQTCNSGSQFYIQSLPYWNSGDVFPCMYSGTFKTSLKENQDHNLFYWLFKNTQLENPNLVLWLNGGPGSSSMTGLFTENGPLEITRTGSGADDFKIGMKKEGSWLDVGDVVFLDQPVGTGFSYGDSVLDRMEDGAKEFILFLLQFIEAFPEYKKSSGRKFYIAGESYAGKYLPLFSKYIDDYVSNNKLDLELKAILIGDPFAAPVIQRTSTHKVAQSLAIIDDLNLEQVAILRKNCEEIVGKDWKTASSICEQTMDYIDEVAGGLFTYDARIFDYDWTKGPIMDDFLTNSGKKNELYKAIHIDQSTKVPIFQHSNPEVSQAYDFEEMIDYTYWYDEMFSIGYQVLLYAGEWDQRDGPTTMEEWLRNSRFLQSSNGQLWEQARKIYYIKQKDGSFAVGGYYRTDPNNKFTFLTVPKSGHFVPTTQLEVTMSFLTDYINNGGLVCHKDKIDDCNTDKIMCKYMNNCNNHGVCQANGQCLCDDKFKAADCSEKAEQLVSSYNRQFETNGTQWIYFQYRQGLYNGYSFDFTLSSKFPMDIYIQGGWESDPNEFQYDIAFKQQNYVKISSKDFPSLETFVAAVRISGIQHYNTVFHQSTLQTKFNVLSSQNDVVSQEEWENLKLQQQLLISEDQQEEQENNETVKVVDDEEEKEDVESYKNEVVFDQNDQYKQQNHEGKHEKRGKGSHKGKRHHGFGGKLLHKINLTFEKFIIAIFAFVIGILYYQRRKANSNMKVNKQTESNSQTEKQV